jgi:hypothetical protein
MAGGERKRGGREGGREGETKVVDVCEPPLANFFSYQLLLLPCRLADAPRGAPLLTTAGRPRRYVPPRCYLRLCVSLGRRAALVVDFRRVFSLGT